jgi:CubicO group peptidase (beta-lactamase class C family)
MKQKIISRISRAREQSVFPGCVVGYVGSHGERTVLSFGRQTYDTASPAIKETSVFDVASITKAVPTSSLALLLIDRGALGLDDRLITYVPEFDNSARKEVLIRHLLTQTLNFGFRLSSFKDRGPEGILHAIYTSEFSEDPGTSSCYSNATSILLGLVVERVFGKSLDAVAGEEFFKPLAMNSTSFVCDAKGIDNVAPTEVDPWRDKMIRGEVHDETAWVLRRAKIFAGSAGLFSTAPDLLLFLEMLLNRGAIGGKRYFSENVIEQMHTNQIENHGQSAGLGWELFQKRYMGKFCGAHTFGKTGFTGCVCVCDIGKHVAFVMLSNYTFPKRKPDTRVIDEVRRDIADIIFSHK